MPMKFKNIGNVLKDTKARTILIIIVVIVLVALLIAWLGLRRAEQPGVPAGAGVQTIPGIRSLPGGGVPSREYAKIQEEENIRKAQEAARTGAAAIPTIVRTTYTGPSEFAPAIPGTVSPECSPESLAKARAAGVKAEELRCKGCSAAELRAAGYTAGELMNAGFSAAELKAAGFSAQELRDAGFTAAELARAGFTPAELAAAGFNAAEMNQAGIGQQQLTQAGITAQQLATAGIGTTPSRLPKDCSVEALRDARNRGISAAELRKMGCGAAALRAAGFSAKELKDAGFSAKELRDAGFSAAELKDAGFTAGELRQAGFSANDLKAAGFNAADLRDAGFSAEDLAAAGFSADDLKAAGFSDGELVRAGITPTLATPAILPPTAPAVSAPITPATSTAVVPPVSPTAAIPAITPSPQEASIAALEALQRRQAEQLSLQERQDRIAQLQQIMAQQAGDLISSWAPPTPQQYIQGPEPTTTTTTAATTTTTELASATGAAGILAGGIGSIPIKSGDIMFAVLDTSLNSDEPSPILAEVVDGPYRGAKLIGQFQRVDQKVLVNFNTMNLPGLPQSVPINAVAIDPNTARTALASHVDTHFLMRYGTLFASSFVSGLARAVEESDSTTTISLNGITTSNAALSAGEKALVGIGEVGKQFGSVLGNLYTRAPTVTVKAGEGIGILFMADVVPASTITTTTGPGLQAPAVTSAGTMPASGALPPQTVTTVVHSPQPGAPNTPVPGTPPVAITTVTPPVTTVTTQQFQQAAQQAVSGP